MSILNNVTIIEDYTSTEAQNYFTNYMKQSAPLFFARVGGSDYDAVRDYYYNKNLIDDKQWYDDVSLRVKKYNGYFDFENKKENFQKYLEDMILFYKNSDAASLGFYKGASSIVIPQHDRDFLNYVLEGKTSLNYDFIEELTPFLKSFKNWGDGKKILIISPLSKSIEYQNQFRDNFFKDYSYPNFQLLTYNSKITYSDNPMDNKHTLNVETSNWHEECQRMAEDIRNIDFDVALLSCASYSMFLGNFIKDVLGKKSIYLGGIVNAYFNIYGGRYAHMEKFHNIFSNAGLNLEYQIDPLELADIDKINSGRGKITESLSAYFGSKDGKYKFKKRTV